MSLLVYECGHSDFGHEIRQWTAVTQALYDYYQGRDELALLIINFNVANVSLDGVLLKEDAVVLLELKDRSGVITARQNGHWECSDNPLNPIIHGGGSNKTVFEQLKVNRRALSRALEDNDYLSKQAVNDIQALVTVTKLEKLKTDFDRETKAWMHITDIEKIGETLHGIKARQGYVLGVPVAVHFGAKDIFNFIRKIKLDERNLVLERSDVHLLPDDLYHPDYPHNGEAFSPGTVLAQNRKELTAYGQEISAFKEQIEAILNKPEMRDNPAAYQALLITKQDALTKDLTGTKLQITVLEQEIARLEASLQGKKAKKAAEQKKISAQITAKNNELAKLNTEVKTKEAELEELKKIIAAAVKNQAKANEPLNPQGTEAETEKTGATTAEKTEASSKEPENSKAKASKQEKLGPLTPKADKADSSGSTNKVAEAKKAPSPKAQAEKAPNDASKGKEERAAGSLLSDEYMKPDKEFSIGEDLLDDDQLDLIERTNDANMLVTGPAGCGKSLIAVHKARQLIKEGKDVILIAFTKSLAAFMEQGDLNDFEQDRFYYHYQWKKEGCPKADYLIVDEIQDFTSNDIQDFVNAAREHYFFFGDTAQSIMNFNNRKIISVEEIAKNLNLKPLKLYSNYRLPQSVARITQDYVGLGVTKFSEKIYKNKEKELPHIIKYDSQQDELEGMIRIMQKQKMSNIGILIGDNDSVLEIHHYLNTHGIDVECKYNVEEVNSNNNKVHTNENGFNFQTSEQKMITYRSANELNFQTSKPKIMTYHSAKGLQFQTVIIPYYDGAYSDMGRRALYVAMTRTFRDLYILYHEPTLAKPLADVPKYLYQDKE